MACLFYFENSTIKHKFRKRKFLFLFNQSMHLLCSFQDFDWLNPQSKYCIRSLLIFFLKKLNFYISEYLQMTRVISSLTKLMENWMLKLIYFWSGVLLRGGHWSNWLALKTALPGYIQHFCNKRLPCIPNRKLVAITTKTQISN